MKSKVAINAQAIWNILADIPDPEIPVISITELGIVRQVNTEDGRLEVVITPTYSGCPAMQMIEEDIGKRLEEEGYQAKITTVLSPAWTTDWIGPEAREKLKKFGIAPPEKPTSDKDTLIGRARACPRCGSQNTEMLSPFGSTPCKAQYKCLECLEPFDYFKCH